MNHVFKHMQMCVIRGFVALIPLFLCYLAVQLLYNMIDKNVVELINKFIKVRHIPGLGILLVVISLYLIGLIVGNIIGRRIFRLIESISKRIPLINAIYGVGKQLSQSLNVDNDKSGFKKAVLVRFNNTLVPGFLSNTISDENITEDRVFVFMPTAPSPTQGFVMAVKKIDVIDPGWTVEECWKVIVTAGIIAPDRIMKTASG